MQKWEYLYITWDSGRVSARPIAKLPDIWVEQTLSALGKSDYYHHDKVPDYGEIMGKNMSQYAAGLLDLLGLEGWNVFGGGGNPVTGGEFWFKRPIED